MNWNDLLQDILYTIITTVVPIITVYTVKFLSTQFNKLKVETDQLIINNTIKEASDIILKVVTSTSQTYVDSLKESGKFDKEAQDKAFNHTKETIFTLLNDETKELIEFLYKDINTWLDVQIESAVRYQKIMIIKEGE